MQKWRPFEVFVMFFCKISQNLYLLIFNTNISHNIHTVQRILFFEVSIIFCNIFNTKKGDPGGVVDGCFLPSAAAGFWPVFLPWQNLREKNWNFL